MPLQGCVQVRQPIQKLPAVIAESFLCILSSALAFLVAYPGKDERKATVCISNLFTLWVHARGPYIRYCRGHKDRDDGKHQEIHFFSFCSAFYSHILSAHSREYPS